MFTVTQTIQSTRPDSEDGPVPVQWYKGESHAHALAAMVQAAAGHEHPSEREWFRVLSVNIEIGA